MPETSPYEPTQPHYQYLGPWKGSRYHQYFLKDRKVRAETLYRRLIGPEPMTPEQVAGDYEVPVEADFEAIDYCEHNQGLLREEREADQALLRSLVSERPATVTTQD
jgi:hypothetical protein